MGTMFAGLLSTGQIENYRDAVVILPWGACEQHGPYLPLLTDTIIAEEIARRAEVSDLEHILLYPPLWLGDSLEHEGFSGTLSHTASTGLAFLQEIFSWLEKSGFRQAVLYNTHGGNKHLAALACEEFSRGHALKVLSVYAYTKVVQEKSLELFGARLSHAGSSEASLLAALRPEIMSQVPQRFAQAAPEADPRLLKVKLSKEIAQDGVLQSGGAVEVDAAKGEILAACMTEELHDQIKWLRNV